MKKQKQENQNLSRLKSLCAELAGDLSRLNLDKSSTQPSKIEKERQMRETLLLDLSIKIRSLS